MFSKLFKPEVTLGTLLQILVIVIGGVVGYNKLEWRLTSLEKHHLETSILLTEAAKERGELTKAIIKLTTIEELRERNLVKVGNSGGE